MQCFLYTSGCHKILFTAFCTCQFISPARNKYSSPIYIVSFETKKRKILRNVASHPKKTLKIPTCKVCDFLASNVVSLAQFQEIKNGK